MKIRYVRDWYSVPFWFLLWCVVTYLSVLLCFALDLRNAFNLAIFVGTQAIYGAVYYVKWRRQCRNRTSELSLIAQSLGLTFLAGSKDYENLLPSNKLDLMQMRKGTPRNLFFGQIEGVDVVLFDMTVHQVRFEADMTVAYFPESIACIPNFSTRGFVGKAQREFLRVARSEDRMMAESHCGQLILYKWAKLVHPQSYPNFLAAAIKKRAAFQELALASAPLSKSDLKQE